MPFISPTPRPPYFAVIFTSINADVDHTEHVEMYQRILAIAQTYDGFIGIELRAIRTARVSLRCIGAIASRSPHSHAIRPISSRNKKAARSGIRTT
jgi:hypothetical protein